MSQLDSESVPGEIERKEKPRARKVTEITSASSQVASKSARAYVDSDKFDVANQTHEVFAAHTYFDFLQSPFEHEKIFEECANDVVKCLDRIGPYAKSWLEAHLVVAASVGTASWSGVLVGKVNIHTSDESLFLPNVVIGKTSSSLQTPYIYLGKGTSVIGACLDSSEGSIWIDEACVIEPFVTVKGPCIIGSCCVLRQSAFLRGNVILGRKCCIRGELKNVLMMDECEYPHPGYIGDSICGYKSHFGNQATTANYGIFQGLRDQPAPLTCNIHGQKVSLGRTKMGAIIGDRTQVGCNSVLDPGTFLGPSSVVYSLTRLNNGFYPRGSLIKNKPLEMGVVQVDVVVQHDEQ